MRCPFCNVDNDKVIDSRASDGGRSIRRRRQCQDCSKRFTTYEKVEDKVSLLVIKKDGSRVPYVRDKVIKGIEVAAYKRPIGIDRINAMADDIEEALFRRGQKEVPSKDIGMLVLAQLRSADHVAYMRFASVYMDVEKVDDLLVELQQVKEEQATQPAKDQGKLF